MMSDRAKRSSEISSRANAEREQIIALDGTLSQDRTPCLKNQLRNAVNWIDMDTILAFANRAESQVNFDAWLTLGELNILTARGIRERIQRLVDDCGGPDKLVERGAA
jgi:hypothetical protein